MESHKTSIYVILLFMGGCNKLHSVMLWPHVHYEKQDTLRLPSIQETHWLPTGMVMSLVISSWPSDIDLRHGTRSWLLVCGIRFNTYSTSKHHANECWYWYDLNKIICWAGFRHIWSWISHVINVHLPHEVILHWNCCSDPPPPFIY